MTETVAYLNRGQSGRAEAKRRFATASKPDDTTPERTVPPLAINDFRQRADMANPALRTAIESIPGYTEAAHLIQQAVDSRDALGPRPVSIEADIDAALVDGAIPDDFAERAHDRAATVARWESAYHAYTALHTAAVNKCASLQIAHTDTILASLDAQLLEVISAARQHARALGDAATTEDVLLAGPEAATAYAALNELWKRYSAIRTAQTRIMTTQPDAYDKARSRRTDDPAGNDLTMSNIDQIMPEWRWSRVKPEGNNPSAVPPWPPAGAMQLAWLINNGARLWVPTLAQLHDLWTVREQDDLRKMHAATKKQDPTKPGPELSKRKRARMHGGPSHPTPAA